MFRPFNHVPNGHDLFKGQNIKELMCTRSGLTLQMHACAMTMLDKCLSLCDAVFKKPANASHIESGDCCIDLTDSRRNDTRKIDGDGREYAL